MKQFIPLTIVLIFSVLNVSSQADISYRLNFENQTVKKFEKAEIGIIIPNVIQKKVNDFISDDTKGINPFDPEQLDLTSTWTSPSGRTQKVNGFYFENYRKINDNAWSKAATPYYWLMRWSPDEIGEWKVEITLNSEGESWKSSIINFSCIESESKGYLTTNPFLPNGDKYLYQVDSDQPFFAIGHNVAHGGFGDLTPKKCENHRIMLKQIADGKGNFGRIELGMVNYLPSGKDCKNYSSVMENLAELDKLFELCTDREVFLIAFRHHVEIESGASWAKSKWSNNSYKNMLQLENRKAYYQDQEAIKWQKNEIRYIMSRWGYAKSFSFYGYSEVDGWIREMAKEEDISELEAMKIFNTWWIDQKKFIETDLQMDRMLFANTFALLGVPKAMAKLPSDKRGLYDIFLHSDIAGYHKYGNGKGYSTDAYKELGDYYSKNWNKPSLLEECGFNTGHIYCANDQDFLNGLWTSVFYNDLGTAMNYWSIRGVNDMGFCQLYEPVFNFNQLIDRRTISSSGYSKNKSLKKTRLAEYHLTSDSLSTIYGYAFDPSYFWRNMTAENQRMHELVFDGKTKEPCETIDDYGIGQPLSNELTDFHFEKYEDAYTAQADKAPLTSENYTAQTISISGLKKSGLFSRKKTYLIEYFDPRDPNLKILKTETVEASRGGKIRVTLDSTNWPACAFIIKPAS